jgi:predicted DNA-binding transcriptional regulator YafY
MPPLLLDDDEAVAMAVGLRLAAGHVVEGIEEASVRALAKLLQVLPDRLRHRVRALGRASIGRLGGDGPAVEPEVLTTLAAAVDNRERVRFDYRAADGYRSERRVEPHGVVAVGRRWYLVAFDVDRDDWRTFRLDRVGSPRPVGGRSSTRRLPAVSPADYVVDTLLDRAPTYEAEVILHLPLTEVRARLGDSATDLVAIGAHRCRCRCLPDTAEWLAARLGALGCDFEIEGPPDLVDALHALGTRLVHATRR